jgi:hypothetical protein
MTVCENPEQIRRRMLWLLELHQVRGFWKRDDCSVEFTNSIRRPKSNEQPVTLTTVSLSQAAIKFATASLI